MLADYELTISAPHPGQTIQGPDHVWSSELNSHSKTQDPDGPLAGSTHTAIPRSGKTHASSLHKKGVPYPSLRPLPLCPLRLMCSGVTTFPPRDFLRRTTMLMAPSPLRSALMACFLSLLMRSTSLILSSQSLTLRRGKARSLSVEALGPGANVCCSYSGAEHQKADTPQTRSERFPLPEGKSS